MKHADHMSLLGKKLKPRVKVAAQSYAPDNALNAICPYFTMFPLEYPLQVLKKYKKELPVVIDPFCGRGTTLFAARKMQFKAWGIDSSPVAVAIAKAKLAKCEIGEPLALAKQILEECEPESIPDTPFFRAAYHTDTLRDLCVLRNGLLNLEEETDSSVVLKAAVLGCLHGPLSKCPENAGYFSNQMPRTYASKPDYAVRYWEKKCLIAPKIDVLHVLRKKISRLIGLPDNLCGSFSQVLLGDSQNSITFESIPSDVSLVITSPPYYGMRTYVQDQWLRNWFLGGSDRVDYTSGPQVHHGGQESFAKSLGSIWRNISEKAPNNLHMHVRFGIIPSTKVNAKELFYASIEASGLQWRVVSSRSAKSAAAGKRQADQMKSSAPAAAIEYDFHVERI